MEGRTIFWKQISRRSGEKEEEESGAAAQGRAIDRAAFSQGELLFKRVEGRKEGRRRSFFLSLLLLSSLPRTATLLVYDPLPRREDILPVGHPVSRRRESQWSRWIIEGRNRRHRERHMNAPNATSLPPSFPRSNPANVVV